MKQYLLVSVMVFGLAACGGSGNSDTDGAVSSPMTTDIKTNLEQSTGDTAFGQIVINGVSSHKAVQLGDLLLISGTKNHILIDMSLNEARFYEVPDNDFDEIAEYSGMGVMTNTKPIKDAETLGDITLTFEDEPTKDAAFMDFTFSNSYSSSETISTISDTYTEQYGEYYKGYQNLSVTIDSVGVLTGSDDSGCILNGDVSQPKSGVGVFYFEVNIANCDYSGDYIGAGYLEKDNVNYLNLYLYSEKHALNFRMY
tara:strand:+ start:1422 stop:2186 length:765 start_codon:yes stop_codon:yes gene_type:complete